MAAMSTSEGLVRIGSLLADGTRAEILCALMDGRAHTGSELAKHLGVANSTVSEHLAKLLDGGLVVVEAHGRHRYWRLANGEVAELLETLGAHSISIDRPRAPAELTRARTCYDHLAGVLAVQMYDSLVANGNLVVDEERLSLSPSGFELFDAIGADTRAISASRRPIARPCLDWTQRRHHLAGAAGKELLDTLLANRWVRRGRRPRTIQITTMGGTELARHFQLPGPG